MGRSLGVTTVAVMAAVERRVCYGLDISHETGLQPGTVYTTLRRLERRQWVTGQWEDAEVAAEERRPRRRYYGLTPDGAIALQDARKRLGGLVVGAGLGAPMHERAR